MTGISRYERVRTRLLAGWQNRAIGIKAVVFGLIGVVNTLVDYGVFLLARAGFDASSGALAAFDAFAGFCQCGSAATLILIASNTISWIVAVTGSYIMNSSITFAAESGRKLRWGAYLTFVLSGVAGWLANTATLLVAAEILLLPVWFAKLCAIGASFVVNFSLSHFIVFRPRSNPAGNAHRDA